MKCVVGTKNWRKLAAKELMRDIATESDESFLVLTLENNWQRWWAEINHDDKVDESTLSDIQALYTNSGKSTKSGSGSSRRFQGWSREGYLRFNELHALVKEDRKKRDTWELMLLDAIKEEFTSKNTTNDNESEDEEDEIFPANDMPGLQPPTNLESGSNNSEEDDQSDENSSQGSENANVN
jgi:hypothetical protein